MFSFALNARPHQNNILDFQPTYKVKNGSRQDLEGTTDTVLNAWQLATYTRSIAVLYGWLHGQTMKQVLV